MKTLTHTLIAGENDMPYSGFVKVDRIVPQLPPKDQKLRLMIDTDFANEVDDLYAVALALATPERFSIEGFIATHFNNSCPGPESIGKSYALLGEFLETAGFGGKYRVARSAPPIAYYGYPSEGDGVDLIIEQAHAGSETDPLWVVGLGASTNLASAILKDPTILPKVRYVFHARSNYEWPERSVQFNVKGDIHAARTLLKKWVPLVWFDTGTDLKCSMELGEKYIASAGAMGRFIHEYRKQYDWMSIDKGFFDMGDIVWMIDPDLCKSETVYAPTMDESMFFDQKQANGKMLRVYEIDNDASWNLLFKNLAENDANR